MLPFSNVSPFDFLLVPSPSCVVRGRQLPSVVTQVFGSESTSSKTAQNNGFPTVQSREQTMREKKEPGKTKLQLFDPTQRPRPKNHSAARVFNESYSCRPARSECFRRLSHLICAVPSSSDEIVREKLLLFFSGVQGWSESLDGQYMVHQELDGKDQGHEWQGCRQVPANQGGF